MASQEDNKNLLQELKEKACLENPYEQPVKLLINGIINEYEPPLKNIKNHLDELVQEQNNLLRKIHTENLNLSEIQHSAELQEMFAKVKLYSNKLHGIKKDMKTLHERSSKLKKRAEKLQQFAEKQSCSSDSKEPIIS